MMHKRYVAVIGSGDATEEETALAVRVGAAVATSGASLVCGGLGGVMEAACRGAKEAGGTTVGILPGHDRLAANSYVDIAIATGLGEMRNAIVVGCADAVVAVGGEYGTLSEIALALRAGKPVVGLGTWELRRRRPDKGVPDKGETTEEGIVEADDPEEAVRLALHLSER
jgi:uncharacterized protein (TIGR00725 family)